VESSPGNEPGQAVGRKWFSKKGLNPDAKVFKFTKKSGDQPFENGSVQSSFDPLNPGGLAPSMRSVPAASTTDSLLRAFAPSPAERAALHRALGGSTNTSFERLPSLSDVSSIPSSPALSQAGVAHPRQQGSVLPSWLQSLPRIGKSNFSPWADEEGISDATTSTGAQL